MPKYVFKCPDGCAFEQFMTLGQYLQGVYLCPLHGLQSMPVIQAPLMVKVAADVHYTSPIDGRPITSHAARNEDLARSDSIPYDPGMKQDQQRHQDESQRALERDIDQSVEEAVEKMSTSERGRLHSELVEQGAGLAIERSTYEGG